MGTIIMGRDYAIWNARWGAKRCQLFSPNAVGRMTDAMLLAIAC
jgi:hypothetical protein